MRNKKVTKQIKNIVITIVAWIIMGTGVFFLMKPFLDFITWHMCINIVVLFSGIYSVARFVYEINE